jgi:DNA-directed RNA polymerase beta' subunit
MKKKSFLGKVFSKFAEGSKNITKAIDNIMRSNLTDSTKVKYLRGIDKEISNKPRIKQHLNETKKKVNQAINEQRRIKQTYTPDVKIRTETNAFLKSAVKKKFENPFFNNKYYTQVEIKLANGEKVIRTLRSDTIPDDKKFVTHVQNVVGTWVSANVYGLSGATGFSILNIIDTKED